MRRFTMLLLVTALCLHAAAAAADKPGRTKTGFFPGSTPEEQRILAALDEQTGIKFADTPLIDALRFLQRQHEINLVMDIPSIEQAGTRTDAPVDLELSGIRLRSALRIMLSDFKLDFVVRNEALTVTSKARAEQWLITRTYPVRDLIDGHGDAWEALMSAVEAAAGTEWKSADNPAAGTMASVPQVGCLVVTQNDRGHDAVVELLNSLRRANENYAIEAGTETEQATAIVAFERVVLNLYDSDPSKCLALGIVLVVAPDKRRAVAVILEQHKPRLKHQLAMLVADRKLEDVMGSKGINDLRTDIVAAFNQILAGKEDCPVSEVLFDEWHVD